MLVDGWPASSHQQQGRAITSAISTGGNAMHLVYSKHPFSSTLADHRPALSFALPLHLPVAAIDSRFHERCSKTENLTVPSLILTYLERYFRPTAGQAWYPWGKHEDLCRNQSTTQLLTDSLQAGLSLWRPWLVARREQVNSSKEFV